MDAAWPDGEEHMAKLSVNDDRRACSTEVAYESNGTHRPIYDAVLGFEHCMVAKARRILDAPPRYLAQVKTDCLLTQRLPKRFAERLRALEALRHPDGTPVYRVEETKPLLGSRAPRMEAERPKQWRWNGVSQLVRDLAGGHRHELTENMRSDPGIFNFVKWLRVGKEACPTLEQAKARLRELFPSKPGWPDTTLVIMAVNAAANRALAPEGSQLLELEIHVICNTPKQPAEHEGVGEGGVGTSECRAGTVGRAEQAQCRAGT